VDVVIYKFIRMCM